MECDFYFHEQYRGNKEPRLQPLAAHAGAQFRERVLVRLGKAGHAPTASMQVCFRSPRSTPSLGTSLDTRPARILHPDVAPQSRNNRTRHPARRALYGARGSTLGRGDLSTRSPLPRQRVKQLLCESEDWGVRDVDEVAALALANRLRLVERIAMPANNLSVVFRRVPA